MTSHSQPWFTHTGANAGVWIFFAAKVAHQESWSRVIITDDVPSWGQATFEL